MEMYILFPLPSMYNNTHTHTASVEMKQLKNYQKLPQFKQQRTQKRKTATSKASQKLPKKGKPRLNPFTS